MKVLVLPATGIGDTIMTLPVIATIKKAHPEAQVDVIVMQEACKVLAKKCKHINDVLLYGMKDYDIRGLLYFGFIKMLPLVWQIRKRNYDWIVSPTPNIIRKILCLIGAKNRLIYATEKGGNPSEKLQTFLSPIGVKELDYDYNLVIGDSDQILNKYALKENGYIVIDPYPTLGRKDLRHWPYFDQLIKSLDKQYKVVLVGRSKEHVPAMWSQALDLVNKTSFDELLHIIKNARLVVACDGGIMHLSYALNTKVLGLFGPIDPEKRIPFENDYLEVVYTNQKCSPCTKNNVTISCANKVNPKICMRSIELIRVIQDVQRLMKTPQ